MFIFNIRTALRGILKNKIASAINLFGLSAAFTALILILMYVVQELSYDRYHEKADRIFRVTRSEVDSNSLQEFQFGHVNYSFTIHSKNEFPEDIEAAVRFSDCSNSLLSYENKRAFVESKLFFADPEIFDVFSWKLITGNPKTALQNINSLVISRTAANRYFGNLENSIGRVLLLNNETPLTVTGVMEDVPDNSHFKPDLLISMSTRERMDGLDMLMTSQSNNDAVYLLLKDGADLDMLKREIPARLDKYYPLIGDGVKSSEVYRYHYWPLSDLHLHFGLDSSTEPNGNYLVLYVLIFTAVLILVIACINFINLSTARLSKRAREVGLRKVIGAHRMSIFVQFICESFLFATLSLCLALVAASLLLPTFNSFLNKSLDLTLLRNPEVLSLVVILLVVVSLAAGGYPAIYLSSFKAADALRQTIGTSWKKFSVRSILVGAQFFVAFLLIAIVIIVRQQLEFINQYDVGFNRSNILVVPASPEMFGKFKTIKDQLESQPGIELVSISSRVPSGRLADAGDAKIERNGQIASLNIRIPDVHVDHDYFQVFGLPIIAGRNFEYGLASDSSEAFVINETAAKSIGWKSNDEAIGKVMHYGNRHGRIIGIVKDFNFESLHEAIKPVVFMITRGRARSLVLRIRETEKNRILSYLAEQYSFWRPGFPFSYYSVTDSYDKQYEKERRIGVGIEFFSFFALLVASLGVFGLSLFMAEQRAKEMGIRKVLGASVRQIVATMSMWFFVLLGVAAVLAAPISYFIGSQWLRTFAFSATIGLTPFIVAFILIGICTLLSISIQMVRTARQSPVRSIGCE